MLNIAAPILPHDYARRIRPKTPVNPQSRGSLITFYFGKAKNNDVPSVIAEAYRDDNIGLRLMAGDIAGLRGFSQFLPEVRDLIRDLDDDTVAPYAGYLLGIRKDPAALEALRQKTLSPITRQRQEAKTAVKKIEKQVN